MLYEPLQLAGVSLYAAREVVQAFCIVELPPSDLTIDKMILTQCAVCATELGLTLGRNAAAAAHATVGPNARSSTGKRAGTTRSANQIKKAGGAERYNANEKYAEAVAVAVEKCADDTKGQTCYICAQRPPLENEGGPRARVRVPRDGGLRARAARAGGAGEDFVRGGRGEQFGRQCV